MPDEPIRDDHAELLRRRALTEDAARPDAVERRHASNGRTARENIDDLVDAGSFVEYGRFAIAAQRFRRDLDDLIARTPADGLVAGTARINGDLFGDERSACAVLSYDYTVLAGTQGYLGHRKKDRLFELIERMRLPTVFFAEGGGGRPGDTDFPTVSSLETRAFKLWAQLSGVVPRIAIVKGRCFAGNAVIAGCLGSDRRHRGRLDRHGRPGDDRRRRTRRRRTPTRSGRSRCRSPTASSTSSSPTRRRRSPSTKRLLGYFQGATAPGDGGDQTRLRTMIPERDRRAYDVGPVIETLADEGSVTFLRPRFAREMVTALGPDRGPAGRGDRQQHAVMAGAITAAAADKAARFLQLCDCFRAPGRVAGRLPGLHGRARPRRPKRWCGAPRGCWSPGAALRVPLVAVVLRRGYGLGAQAMTGGSLHEPVLTVAWPGAHLGPMGLEGAVRLGLRKELEAIADDDEREERVRRRRRRRRTMPRRSTPPQLFEIDDVIDPADTRRIIAETLTAATAHAQPSAPRRFVDTW